MIRCVIILTLVQGITCVYFTEKRPVVCLNSAASVGSVLGRVFAHSNTGDNCSSGELSYDIDEESGSIAVNNTGWLTLTKQISGSFTGTPTITARCTAPDGATREANTTMAIKLSHPAQTGQTLSDETLDQLCYGATSDVFAIEENTVDVIVGTINRCKDVDGVTVSYKVNKPKTKFSIDPMTSDIRLLRALDRESLTTQGTRGSSSNNTGIQPLRVTCTVEAGGKMYTARRRTLNIVVSDINDNPPVFQKERGMQYLETSVEITEGSQTDTKIDEVVLDLDEWHNNSHVVEVVSDPQSVCQAVPSCGYPNLDKTICRFLIQLENLDRIQGPSYRCEVRLVDTNYIQLPGNNFSNAATMVVNIHKTSAVKPPPKHHITESRTVYRNAARFSRVIQLTSSSATGVTYSLFDSIFAVTEKFGIVYVDQPSFLLTAPENITIVVHKSPSTDIHLHIQLLDSPRRQDKCESGCSTYDTAATCQAGCGLGLATGNCVMRGDETNSRMDYNYGTCTHDITTCPDRTCDELEYKFKSLCPQDCTTEVNGVYFLNTNNVPPRGIAKAKGPCWCEEDYEIICTCMPGHSQHVQDIVLRPQADSQSADIVNVSSTEKPKPSTTQTTVVVTNSTYNVANIKGFKQLGDVLTKTAVNTDDTADTEQNNTEHGEALAISSEETSTPCDTLCATGIGLGSGALIAISFSLFMLWFTKKKNDRRKSNLKHVGSVVSMTAVPSDYYDESDRRVSYSSPQWTPKGPANTTQGQQLPRPENSKWEIPRESLTLDQTLGEGEFGRVVKAKALGLDGEHTEKNVAVKMLKNCATAAEEQDLWSEFNLLKDVNHPNVIRLLGVCTGEGPFYVIVEYCEHGCLLKYLRRSRLEENGYVNQKIKYRYQSPDSREQTDPSQHGDLLTMRDLLSFAWQIAKGMSYLSSIKLVHRDLAARNVLVSADRMLKISDFGLTRDVYEADTYLKKSRGRIPVKWLAPESLYAQIYTTKSDVWSYGIVLWEIVTLGAPPYPGIPPERLYNLLIGGYRMDRPENCQDEMYAVMQKCWKTDASDRPTFSSLAEIFDRILQEKTGYLDLSALGRGRHDFYRRCLNSSSEEEMTSEHSTAMDSSSDSVKIEDMELTTVCNNTYLTPATANIESNSTPLLNSITPHLEDELDSPSLNTRKPANTDRGSGHFLRKVTGIAVTPQKQSRGGNLVHPSENISLLKDSGRAMFVNLPDSTEEENITRVTLEC